MPPPFTSPRSAVEGVIEAYREGDIDEIARARDFTADSSIFWHGLRLPVSNEQLRESAEAFEISFRRQLEEVMERIERTGVTSDASNETRHSTPKRKDRK